MRIFTLGKNGIPLFLFAFILLSGTYSYGQSCPTVNDPNQSFCDSAIPEVEDLMASGADIAWYAEENSTEPLPSTQILEDGETYYAGTTTGDCSGTRPMVTVAVYNAPVITGIKAPTIAAQAMTTKQSAIGSITLCVQDVTNPGVTVSDLTTNADDGDVQWYLSNAPGAAALDPNEPLIDNQVYWVDQGNPDGSCRSSRNSVKILFNSEPAPTGAAAQEFCSVDAPTLADIEASGEVRYYTSATSGVELSQDTPLEDGETYYLASVGEICNSIDRLAVTITINEGAILEPQTGIVCQTEVSTIFPNYTTIKNYYLGLLDEGVPTNGTFEPTPQELSAMYLNDSDQLGDFTTTYTVGDGESACSDSVELTVTVVEAVEANAGDIADLELCVVEESFNLFTHLPNESTDGGTFTDADGNEITDGIFQVTGTGSFVITYTVNGDNPDTCITGTATSDFIVTVSEGGANAGDDINLALCSAQVEYYIANPDEAMAFFDSIIPDDVDQTGTFNPSLETIVAQWQSNPIGTFTSTYTVGEGECQDSAVVTIVVTEGNADAGEPNTAIVCQTEVSSIFPDYTTIKNYYLGLLDEGVPTNGTFDPTPRELSEMYLNDSDQLGDFTTTYTVGDGECQDSVQLTVSVAESFNAGEDATINLPEEATEIVDLFAELGGDPQTEGSWTDADGNPFDGTFDPTTDPEGTYTYTGINGTTECTGSATVTVNIGGTPQPSCPEITNPEQTFCSGNNPTVADLSPADAVWFASEEATEALSTDTPLEDGTAYYAGNADGTCQTRGMVTVTINEGNANAGDDINLALCSAQVEYYIANPDEAMAFFDSIIPDDVDQTGTFDPSLETIVAQWQSNPIGTFTSTYTVGDGECQDSAVVTIVVTEGNADAGEPNTAIVCQAEVSSIFPSYETIKNYYLGLLDEGVPTNGTFDPTPRELSEEYLNGDQLGDFTTTYTVGNGECEDSVQLTVTVAPSFNAGENAEINLPEGATETVDLFAELGGEPETGGSWTDANGNPFDGTFDPATDPEGTYTYTGTNVGSECETSATVTVTIGNVSPTCPEITDAEQTFCSGNNPTVADLSPADAVWFASEDATEALSTDTPLEDGTAYYAGNADGTCETRGTVTVTLSDAPAAPEVSDATFCVVEGATIADLATSNGNLRYYTDEALTAPAAETDLLVDGVYYVTTTSEGGCESTATVMTITLTDGPAPTLVQDGDVFCEFDNPTIADLQSNIEEDGTITFYDAATGGNELNVSTSLQNGTTYYAALTDATSGCESSERLAITVTLESCEVVVPEIFTPNGDGMNDRFTIPNLAEQYPNYKLEIYNRWGNLVFEGNASTSDWDGVSTTSRTLGDNVVPNGVYFYILYYNDGQTEPVQGRLYLNR